MPVKIIFAKGYYIAENIEEETSYKEMKGKNDVYVSFLAIKNAFEFECRFCRYTNRDC